MSELPLILDEAGLSNPATLVQLVAAMPFRELQALLVRVSDGLPTVQSITRDTVSPNLGFDFLASSSIRGDSFCRACARDKVRSLARYAALYCDRVLLPMPGLHPVRRDSREWRAQVTERLFFLQDLRPVLEANIVQLFRPFQFCAEHWRVFNATTAPIRRRAENLYRERFNDFEVIYRPRTRMWGPSIELTGPEEYVEHGRLMTLFRSNPVWAPKQLHEIGGGLGKRLSATTIKKSGIVKRFFDVLALDLIFHQMIGEQHNVKYITDLTGEAQFFGAGDDMDGRKSAVAALVARLAHSVPLFHELPVRTILKIRRQETDSFDVYRRALANIVETHVKPGQVVSERVASDLYNDVLRPSLLKLKIEATSKKRESRIKAAAKLGVPTALISLGVVSGLVPHDIAQLLKAVGISSLLTQAADALTSLGRNPPELRNQDLYFLLRLSEQT